MSLAMTLLEMAIRDEITMDELRRRITALSLSDAELAELLGIVIETKRRLAVA